MQEIDPVLLSAEMNDALGAGGVEHVRIAVRGREIESIIFFRGADPLAAETIIRAAVTAYVEVNAQLRGFTLISCELDFFLTIEFGQYFSDEQD